MSASTTNTMQLVMSRASDNEFDRELIDTAIADIINHPFRKAQLRIPLRPVEGEETLSFDNEMFGGQDNEDYSHIFAEILSYTGNTAANAEQAKTKTFRIPLGYANIHIIFAKKKARCEIRTNLNGEVKYLNKFCVLPLSQEHASFTETETSSNGATLKTSNALFLSKYAVIDVTEPVAPKKSSATGGASASANDDDAPSATSSPVAPGAHPSRMSYANTKLIEYMNYMKKNFTVEKPDLSPFKEDDDQREVIYVVKLDDCLVTIDTTETYPNSFARLKVIYKALQAHLRKLDAMQVTIVNKIEEINGKRRPTKFGYLMLPPDEGKGGRVVLPDDITYERCTVPLTPFAGKLFGFGNPQPDDEAMFDTVKGFLYVYGFHLPDDLDLTGFRERKQRQQNNGGAAQAASNGHNGGAAPAASNGNRASSGNASKAKEFFPQRGGRGAPPAYGGRGNNGGRGH
jgi:hypothetical protein